MCFTGFSLREYTARNHLLVLKFSVHTIIYSDTQIHYRVFLYTNLKVKTYKNREYSCIRVLKKKKKTEHTPARRLEIRNSREPHFEFPVVSDVQLTAKITTGNNAFNEHSDSLDPTHTV